MSLMLYVLAAAAEILGCFAVWHWWRGGAALWLIPGAAALGLFAFLLALTPPAHAGRSFAAYGGSISPHRWSGWRWWKACVRIGRI